MSGPLLDRIDIQLEVPRPIELEGGSESPAETSSAQMRKVVLAARARKERRDEELGLKPGARLSGATLRRSILMKKEAFELLDHALTVLNISMRAYDRILRLARTIADVEGSEYVEDVHAAEAIQYRRLDI